MKRFPMGRVWKLSETLSYGSRLETQRNAFLWVAFQVLIKILDSFPNSPQKNGFSRELSEKILYSKP
ncbi:hypothetical protein [Leptospira santarosai]|uniref:Uncharacterized protein n=1 Tax=Leptospira santarosai str. ZUN179 TaxID=1049985 RepID=M6UJY6_9LEPT|nr:hypothetical protein [Leptospira santarosai]EMO44865.1 hypothetical protein LEP1GSC187_2564 [Leptospira santarosai str. ZUN179]